MAATRKPRSPSAADHLRFLRPGALARLRDARLRRQRRTAANHLRFLRPGALARLRDARLRRQRRTASRPAPPSPSSPSPSPPPAPAADRESGGPFLPYYVPASRLLAPRFPQRRKHTAAKAVTLYSPPSSDLPFEAVMEFLNVPDMVVAAH